MGFWFKKEDKSKDKTEEYDMQPLSKEELEKITGGKPKNGGSIVPGGGLRCGLLTDSDF